MAAAFDQKCPMRIPNSDCFKDHSSTETIECSTVSSNLGPTSPLEVAFERDTQGVPVIGLGLVPYLAGLWLEDPFDRRIVFGINMGIDHCSKSLIEGSKSNAFGENFSNPTPTARIPNSTPLSSLFSPASHILQISSVPEIMQQVFEASPNYEFHPNYYSSKLCAGSNILMGSAGSEGLVSSGSSEYMYGYLDAGQIAYQEEYTHVVVRDMNQMTSTHHIYNNRSIMEPRLVVGGLSATFGDRAPPFPGFKYPTEGFMTHCHLCKIPLNKEQNDIYIFKGEFAYCSKQCRQVDIDMEEKKEKAETKAQKQMAAKRLQRAGKSPVVFRIASDK